jgi:LysM domain
MAALTYPIGVIPQRRLRVVAPIDASSALSGQLPWSFQEQARPTPRVASIGARRHQHEVFARRRRLVSLAVCALVLLATWGVANCLSGLQSSKLATIPGTQVTPNGYIYTVQPGDTVWSIATRLVPNGDPRPVVDEIDAHLSDAAIVPGQRLLIP